jgi:DNA-binding NtrC family response regulator
VRVSRPDFRARRVWHARRILAASMSAVPDPRSPQATPGYHGAVSDFKRRLIETTLHETRGNRTHAARTLGLQRTYLLRLPRADGLLNNGGAKRAPPLPPRFTRGATTVSARRRRR